MLRSLTSGVSGMRVNQTRMDVIGNNIANVNTVAFKGARVTFKDMFNQTLQGTSAPNANIGGTNAMQVGLGVNIASVDTNMTQGALQPTGRSTDLAIEGNGFFIVSNGSEYKYTRDGSFKLDKNGDLVTSEGLHVLGANKVKNPAAPPADLTNITDPSQLDKITIPLEYDYGSGPVALLSFTIEKDGKIKAIYGDQIVDVGQIALATFQNPAGLLKSGSNLYTESSNSGKPNIKEASSPGFGTIQQGMLEMSNVDLAEQFTDMIVTSRAFQANSRTITTSDEMLQELLNLKR